MQQAKTTARAQVGTGARRTARLLFCGCCMIAVMLLASGLAPRPEPPLERFEYKQVHMGVPARLVLYAPGEGVARRAAQAAFRRVAALDDILSDYRPTSELRRLGAAGQAAPVPVSEDLFLVLERAQLLSRLSDGAFDVTAGPHIRLWRSARRRGELPSPDSLRLARSRVGWRQLRLDSQRRTAQLSAAGLELDVGGIAKGYAADEALEVLRQHGLARALVELGGDIVVGAPPPGRAGWQVEVPNADAGTGALLLAHAAISTSGDTEQFVEIAGTRYSHIVDPQTGVGLTDRVSVTVLSPSGLLSDGLSTTLSVLGPDRAAALVAEHFPGVRVWVRRAAAG
jgi:thiamine biosynthesis lipoprotein